MRCISVLMVYHIKSNRDGYMMDPNTAAIHPQCFGVICLLKRQMV